MIREMDGFWLVVDNLVTLARSNVRLNREQLTSVVKVNILVARNLIYGKSCCASFFISRKIIRFSQVGSFSNDFHG